MCVCACTHSCGRACVLCVMLFVVVISVLLYRSLNCCDTLEYLHENCIWKKNKKTRLYSKILTSGLVTFGAYFKLIL